MTRLRFDDPDIYNAIAAEDKRQQETINLIASENYASRAILQAQGSSLTNKYAEGYPGKRYYGGCHNMDTIETIAIDRCKELFKAEHANVQPHSGAQANMGAYFALIKPGDTIMGMSLSHGGHLTHGAKANFTGKMYNVVAYGLDQETERIDYAAMEKLADESQPKIIVAGASAYPRVIDFERIRRICDKVGAKMMVDMAHIAGLVAAGVHPSPVPYADVVTSTTHKTLRGPRGGFVLCKADLAHAIDSAMFPGIQGGPLMHVLAGKAVAFREAATPEFGDYARQILANSKTLARELQKHGFRLVSGGTDNHLVLLDLTATGVNGKDAEEALGRCNIVVNRNTVPFVATQKATAPNGMRLGTPAVTTRGFGEAEMVRIAAWVHEVIKNFGNPEVEARIAAEVRTLTEKFPVPGITD
ncbi:serine hydroxymethyltransferase [Dehalogenimonas etheniformans]|uniref:Serine hydroxymethyltransferase n=1 Tax=Dehalogenimonas etheniformans TaxID=1536648 RepID=A0A2P5P5B3_9CHLR|nr:serine hydroxymethyltransferase [Dehalogenimonas etheniformans]PPD57481.1 serine hydroxymethyltransferase [Dehalogenimonas etheniformans]QNT76844.1 serine hydroxymethyltransferase [Dehalogenimonas etheniformans]